MFDKNVAVPADKASNNMFFLCKTYYIDCLVNDFLINHNTGNPTYTPTSLSKDEILSNHNSVVSSFGLLKMITLTYHLYIGYLSYTSVHTKQGILQDLLSVPRSHCRSSLPLYFPQSKIDSRLTLIPSIHVMASTRCGF